MSRPIEGLPGLGRVSAGWLRGVGIDSESDLRVVGAAAAYLRVQHAGFAPSRNLLWAIHGAIHGKAANAVTRAERSALLREIERLMGR